MKFFIVQLKVSSANLGTVLEVVAGKAELKKVVAEDLIAAPKLEAPQNPSRYVNGIRNKGIKGDDLLVEILCTLNGRSFTKTWLEEKFVERGFARHTASPIISKAMSAGLLRNVGHATYEERRPEPGPKERLR